MVTEMKRAFKESGNLKLVEIHKLKGKEKKRMKNTIEHPKAVGQYQCKASIASWNPRRGRK